MATLEAPVRPRTTSHQGPFVTEPFFDFRNEENARRMRSAIAKVRGQLGHEYDLIIGGKHIKTTDKIKSLNPTHPSQIVGIHQKAGKEHVEPAMQAALAAFESWSRTSVEERTSLIFRVGDLLRQRKMEFMAWLVFEVSKNWAEADADISETIDFCEFYASRGRFRSPYRAPRAGCPSRARSFRSCGNSGKDFLSDLQESRLSVTDFYSLKCADHGHYRESRTAGG